MRRVSSSQPDRESAAICVRRQKTNRPQEGREENREKSHRERKNRLPPERWAHQREGAESTTETRTTGEERGRKRVKNPPLPTPHRHRRCHWDLRPTPIFKRKVGFDAQLPPTVAFIQDWRERQRPAEKSRRVQNSRRAKVTDRCFLAPRPIDELIVPRLGARSAIRPISFEESGRCKCMMSYASITRARHQCSGSRRSHQAGGWYCGSCTRELETGALSSKISSIPKSGWAVSTYEEDSSGGAYQCAS